MLQHRLAGPRIERDAGLLAEAADHLQRAIQVTVGLGVHGDDVGAGLGVLREVGLRRIDHQVHVERLRGVLADGADHRRAERQIGDEVAVHHVDMHEVATGFVDGAHLLAQSGEVGREDRWRDTDGPSHPQHTIARSFATLCIAPTPRYGLPRRAPIISWVWPANRMARSHYTKHSRHASPRRPGGWTSPVSFAAVAARRSTMRDRVTR